MSDEKFGHGYYTVIPMRVLLDEELPAKSRLLFGIIANLSNVKGYCFATNTYLSELTGWHEKTISDFIAILSRKQYLYRFDQVTKHGLERRLYLFEGERGSVVNPLPPLEPVDDGGCSQMTTHNNNILIIKDNINTIAESKDSAYQKALFEDNSGIEDRTTETIEDRSTEREKKKEKKNKKEKEKVTHPEFKAFVDIWCSKFPSIGLGQNPALGGKMINSIIEQTIEVIKDHPQWMGGAEANINFWRIFIDNLEGTWHEGRTLDIISKHFKTIVYRLEHQEKFQVKRLYKQPTAADIFSPYASL